MGNGYYEEDRCSRPENSQVVGGSSKAVPKEFPHMVTRLQLFAVLFLSIPLFNPIRIYTFLKYFNLINFWEDIQNVKI